MIYFDPNVNDDDFVTASKKAWKTFYKTPEEIIGMYPEVSERVKANLRSLEDPVEQFEPKNNTDTPLDNHKWGSKYRLIDTIITQQYIPAHVHFLIRT